MVESDHISFRSGEDLRERADDLADRYGMNRSQFLRLVVGKAVTTIEDGGLDAFVDGEEHRDQSDDAETAEQPAD